MQRKSRFRCAIRAGVFRLEKADPDNYRVTTLSHGRGICMIRSLVDEVSFAHHGAEIVMRKRMTDDAG